MDKEKTSKIAERLRTISSRSGEVARDVLRRMINATIAAQIAESPAVMTAAGQKIEKDGSVSFDHAEDPGVIKLRNNLPKIGAAGILGSTYGVLGPRGIARYALEGIDYTSPSHWVARGAAKLGLGASQAYDLGLVSDMVASAYPGFRKSVNGLKNMYHGIGDYDAVSEGAKEALIGLGGFGLGHLVGWGWNAAANGIRKAKNLARIDDLKTLGEYDDIVSNLRRYHSGHALDRPGVGKIDNVRVEVAPSMAGGTADADYSGWSDIIRINPDAKHLQLGREYTNALLAHEGTHAAFNRMPVSSQVSVDGRDYFMANSANPDVSPVAHLFQRNDPKGVGTWMGSPEEYVSEMGFLRQLTGQNKRFGDLSPFYKNRFNTYLSNRFDFTPKESLQVIDALGKKYPGGGKFFRTNLQNESPLMYQPILPSYPDVPTLMRYEPLPHYGLYEYPSSTGMVKDYPVTLPPRVPVAVSRDVSAPEVVEAPIENLFSDEMVARRALKQRYAESAFNDKAKSKAGAQGAWQIMPITLKDYLGRGKGKTGDLNDPEYNRKVRDWVMGIIPRDLKEFWSESDSDRAKLAKLYAAYNWGAGNLRSFLRKKRDAGVDISNPGNWVEDLNPETRRYVKYLAFDEDIPDSTVYTNAAFEKAAAERGYANGGRLYEMGGPSGPINPNVLRQAVKQTLLRAIPRNILVGAADLADNAAGIPGFRQIKEIPESGKFYTNALDNGESEYYEDGYIENPGLTFLLDRGRQSEMLQKMGYHPVNDGYYGSVTSATRKLNALKGDAIPIFQRGDDEVDFSEVEPVADKDGNYFFERTSYLGDIFGENELNHASYHPVSFYRHKGTGDIYVRGYDLNDYGKHDKNMWRNFPEALGNSLFNQGYSYDKTGQTYGDEQYLAEIYDYIGNPFVQRTALVKAPEELVRKYFGEEYASGGRIHIKPENRGKFTALKKRTGHSASWFKAHGTPAQKKMAVFALNSRKWKHGDGGPIDRYSPEQIRAAIAKLKETKK